MKKKLLIQGVMFIFLVLIFQFALAQNTEEQDAGESLQIALQSMNPEDELVHLRSINQRTFKKEDGKKITYISTEPLNYLTEDAQLQPIDTNVSSAGSDKSMRTLSIGGRVENKYKYQVLKNTIKAWFADQSDGGVKLEYEQKNIEFILEHAKKSKAVVEENKIN